MHADLVWLTVILSSFPLITLCDPLNVLAAPSVLHVGTDEKVFVEAQDYSGNDLQVKISIKQYPQKRMELTSAISTLTAANNYQALVNIKIPNNMSFYSDDAPEKQYVYVQAQFPTSLLEKVVLVSFQSGHIFVQTDKSIYTPGETVLYRAFLLTSDLKPVEYPGRISVEIINADGLKIARQVLHAKEATIKGIYRIPDHVKFGIWTILVWYINNPQKNFTAQFEVKEYVLPSFEVAFKPSKPFFYVDDKELKVEITAKYLFGKNVDGVAFVLFGVKKDVRIPLPKSLSRITITNGVGRAVITRSTIQRSSINIDELEGGSFFISASVLTQTGSEMVGAEKGGIPIVKSPYNIEFERTPKYFHPGLPFHVTVHVTNPDQSPAENVDVVIRAGEEQGEVRARTRSNGIANVNVNTDRGWSALQITARTDVPGILPERQAENKLKAEAYTTKGDSGDYLHISADSAEVEINKHTKFNLMLKSRVQDQDLTYLILSKGQIVKAARFKRKGQSLISLSEWITKDLVPSFRLVVYYHIGSEVLSDSIRVGVKDTCMGTLKLHVKQGSEKILQPGDGFDLVVTGEPSATVGLVAVDKGAFLLNKNRLTQSTVWDLIEKYDTGCTAGSGKDSMGVFYDAGLLFQSDKAGGTKTRTDIQCSTSPKRKRRDLQFSRSLDVDDDDYYDDDYATRTKFPESWFWEEISLPACPGSTPCTTTSITLDTNFLEDSITTWEILAISLSKTQGICVADPYAITVAKDLLVDLKFPSTAVHKEQVEMKAIVHNLSNKQQRVRVEFIKTEHICSVASKNYRTVIDVDAGSSRWVPFVIIPMSLGELSITVRAASALLHDVVTKTMNVAPEGILTKEETKVDLDPAQFLGGIQIIQMKSIIPSRQVPDTPAYSYISVTGRQMRHTIEQVISGDFMGRLIIRPTGDGDQVMISMTSPLTATHYLDVTNQWDAVGPDRRNEAIQHIMTGYVQGLTLRKDDGSYASFVSRPSSTWLTAYVTKVFAMASDLISVDENVLCGAIKWLIRNAQQSDGTFKESGPVMQSEMVGDVQGQDSTASLTAFVLIALQEGSHLCATSFADLSASSNLALSYLERRLPSLTNPYAIAMTSYALANAGKCNKDVLLRASSEDGSHWEVSGGQHFSVEATAYALLALVKAKEFDAAGKAVRWLNKQSIHYGGVGTTQATIMVFQALAEYYKQVRKQENLYLDVELHVNGRHFRAKWRFNSETFHVTRSDKVLLHQGFNVTAKGTAAGVLQVIRTYYARPTEKQSDCKRFTVSVDMQKEAKTSYQDAEESYMLTISILFNDPDRDATMTILDIGLLPGFVADKNHLKDLISESNKNIQKFDMDKELSDHGSLVVYLDQVSHTVPQRIAFRVHKMNTVDHLQPAAVSVYEYDSPGDYCANFYHPTKKEGALRKLCSKQEECVCAEENCSVQKKLNVKNHEREKNACDPDINYVYKVKLVETNLNPTTDFYEMEMQEILREGNDRVEPWSRRTFIGHSDCRGAFNFVKGKSYLIMGRSADIWHQYFRMLYILREKVWIEYWPTREESQTQEYRERYEGLNALVEKLDSVGCHN